MEKNETYIEIPVESNRHLNELETLYKISQILSEGTAQDQSLSEVLNILDSNLGMARGAITLLSPAGNQIMIEAVHNFPEEQKKKIKYRLGEGITGKVLQTGKPIIVPKVSQEPLFLNRFERWNISKEEISFICVPISIGDETIGTISIDKPFDKSVSLEEDMRLLSIVASMIANNVKTRREETLRLQTLEDENLRLRSELEDKFRPENIIGNSNLMRQVYHQIHQVAGSDTTVLI